jgi:cytochrome c-type biogenesis protein CcmH/NrfG
MKQQDIEAAIGYLRRIFTRNPEEIAQLDRIITALQQQLQKQQKKGSTP